MAQGVSLLRPLEQADVSCPAGTVHGEATVFCAVEGNPIEGRLNPDSVAGYCCGNFMACPSWRAQKEWEWGASDRAPGQLTDHERLIKAASRQRVERAKELMHSDTEEGRRYRAEVRAKLEQIEAFRLYRERLERERLEALMRVA